MRVFLAGATGALGAPLVRALVAAGHEVTGTSRTPARAAAVDAAGGHGVVCDALDRDAVFAAVSAAAPEVVVHQLTSLPAKYLALRKGSDPTNRLRREGTRHLVDAAVAAGARRMIAQSIAFLYEPSGPAVATEESPVWTAAAPAAGGMLAAALELERIVLHTDGIDGVVLRYGALYGPGTWYAPDGDIISLIRARRLPVIGDGGALTSFVHVDDAATATVRALDAGEPGIYNITDDAPVADRGATAGPGCARRRQAAPPGAALAGARGRRIGGRRDADRTARRVQREGEGVTRLDAEVPDVALRLPGRLRLIPAGDRLLCSLPVSGLLRCGRPSCSPSVSRANGRRPYPVTLAAGRGPASTGSAGVQPRATRTASASGIRSGSPCPGRIRSASRSASGSTASRVSRSWKNAGGNCGPTRLTAECPVTSSSPVHTAPAAGKR